ncbi:MAG TPA: nucleoside triphosphate pyrophosphohydrolase [Micromonosporaceae bacterium]|nr:nucleoside triphosphate pyrophosphohydrolase [Micromonosporaceae bacterium]
MEGAGKLVRDRIPELITEAGGQPQTRVARGEEYPALLRLKLLEEVQEFLDSDDAGELVDVIEVVYALARHKGVEPVELEELRADKERERGSFLTRTVLITTGEESDEQPEQPVSAPPVGPPQGTASVPGTQPAAPGVSRSGPSGGTVYRGSSAVPGRGWPEVAGTAP